MLGVLTARRKVVVFVFSLVVLAATGCRDSDANGVQSVNGLTGNITVEGGSDVTLEQSGSTITINASSAIEGPAGAQGEPGPTGATGPGLEADLTRIFNLSWVHGATSDLTVVVDGNPVFGFVVAFGRSGMGDTGVVVDASSLNSSTFEVYTEEIDNPTLQTYRQLRIEPDSVVPVEVLATVSNVITEVQTVGGSIAPAALVVLNTDAVSYLVSNNAKVIIRLKGDFVLDENGRAIDAEFVRAELPTGDRESGGSYGSQGGLFESWVVAN